MNAFYAQQQSYPQWTQPPFQGPPPMPNGVNVSQQQWQQGQWQFNSAFGQQPPNSAPPQAQWAPGQGWFYQNVNAASKPNGAVSAPNPYAAQQAAASQQQAQAQASRNPYKRYPKPPSQEYLSYQLKDNGLGLFDMVPREEVYKDKEPPTGADQTPWVWHPKRFPGEEDTGIVTAYFKDEFGNRDEQYRGQVNGTERRVTDQSERKDFSPNPPEAATNPEPGRSRSGSGILRRRDTGDSDVYQPNREQERAWEYEGERERAKEKNKKEKHKKDKVKDKHRSEESPGSSFTRVSPQKASSRSTPAPVSSASAYAEQQAQARGDRSQRVRFESPPSSAITLPQPITPNSTKLQSQPRSNTEPAISSSASVPHQPQPIQAHEGFSSRTELRPTFSPRIVRTPDHYRTNSSSSSTPSRSSSISRSSTTSARSLDYPNANSSTTVSGSTPPQPLHRHATAPAAFRADREEPHNVSGVSHFTDEPASAHQLLSPLFPTHSHSRSLSRGSHHAHSLSSIPEGPGSLSNRQKNSPQRSNYSPAGSGSTTESESNSSSPYWSGDPPSRSSPNHPQSQPSSRKRSPLSNPLPTPPRESQVPLSMPSSFGQHDRAAFDSRPQPGMRIRKGYWSRRGVHLTKDGDLIHPPDDRIFPPELNHYPEDTSIFQDHKGRQKQVDIWKQLPSHNRRIDDYISYVT